MPEPTYLTLDDKIATFLRRAVDDTFMTAFCIETHPEVWSLGRENPAFDDALHASHILIKQGTAPIGAFIVAINHGVLLKILNAKEPADPAMLQDAVMELTNMLYGVFKTKVNAGTHGEGGAKLAMGLPLPLKHPKEAFATFDAAEKLTLPFLADGRKCWVSIAQTR